jgi:hypothetical protein
MGSLAQDESILFLTERLPDSMPSLLYRKLSSRVGPPAPRALEQREILACWLQRAAANLLKTVVSLPSGC